MLPDVQVPDYQTAYNSLGNVYDPMTASVNSQLADLPRQQQAVQSSLDQAKVNAFRDITNSANAKGMLFSGFTPDQQAQYIGTKYLPAVAQNQTSFNNARTSLVDKINQINAQRSQQAQGIVSSAQTAAQNAAYKNAQLALAQQKANASGGLTPYQMLEQQQKAAGAFSMKQGSQGQYMFTGANNKPVNMATFLQGSGSTGQDLINLLANGTGYDRNVLAKMQSNPQFKQILQNQDSNALANLVKKYDTGKYYGF